MIGTGLSLAIYVGSNAGYQFTRQDQLSKDWNSSHPTAATASPGKFLTLQRPRLALGKALAKITVPSINWAGIVLEGTDGKVLSGGPGHLVGTAYPGESDNVVISNHNSYSQQWSGVKEGQVIRLDADYGSYTYAVTGFRVVEASDLSPTASTGRPTMTFITCWPLYLGALARQRYVVTAELQG